MRFNGHEAIGEFGEDACIFHGEVINPRDVITFQGQSGDELKDAFAASVQDYLAFRASRGDGPEKPFTGQFVVRTPPELHRAVSSAAKRAGVSLNKWVMTALERAVAN